MAATATRKRQWQWAGLALLCAAIAGAALFVPGRISQIELGREAFVAAERLHAQLMTEPDALFDAVGRPQQFAAILDKSGYGHRVLRYELYDPDGDLAFTSGQSGLTLSGDWAGLPAGGSSRPFTVTLHDGAAGLDITHFAALTLPLTLNRTPRGTLIVYLDQSDQANVLSSYFGLIAAITLLLLCIGIATPVAVAWMRSEERRRAEAQVRYLESHDALTGLANRKAFDNALADAMLRMHRDRTHIAVLCLDIDKFKEINDAVEHAGATPCSRKSACAFGPRCARAI
jgi:hypothetical protein